VGNYAQGAGYFVPLRKMWIMLLFLDCKPRAGNWLTMGYNDFGMVLCTMGRDLLVRAGND